MDDISLLFLTLGGLFVAGLVADIAARRTRLPRVTLLLVIGIAVGPAGLSLIPEITNGWFETVSTAALALVAFFLLGVGISASSTPFLAYMAERVEESRMAGAAALTWILMIVGIILTAAIGGAFLDPFSPTRLVQVAAGITGGAFLLTVVAVIGRRGSEPIHLREDSETRGAFREVLRAMWEDRQSRAFAMFIFVSMLAYSAQDIILEPFAGAVFGMTPGESTQIAAQQHAGVLIGMIVGAFLAARFWTLTRWAAAGCLGSAVALLGVENIDYGIDRIVAVFPDGRARSWNQINRCGEVVFDGAPAPEGCPPVPERLQ